MSERRNVTFNIANYNGAHGDFTDSTIVKDHDPKQVEDDDGDAPVVFLCGHCKLPIGDSLSWVGIEDEQNQILLKRVSDNILIGKETLISGTRKELGCLIVHLTCGGCSSLLGMVYTSTPKKLDYKRSLFCLNVAAIDSYVLGSSNQQVAVMDASEEPVTLEYKHTVEQQLAKIKALTVTMGLKLLEIEADLQSKSSDVM